MYGFVELEELELLLEEDSIEESLELELCDSLESELKLELVVPELLTDDSLELEEWSSELLLEEEWLELEESMLDDEGSSDDSDSLSDEKEECPPEELLESASLDWED